MEQAGPPLSLNELSKFKIEDNITFSLRDMEAFIKSITQRKVAVLESRFRPTSELNSLPQNQLPSVRYWSEDYTPFKLLEIESSVAENLQTWIDYHISKADNPVKGLGYLIEAYHAKAASYYSGRPEGASRMILTILELWYAAYVAAIQELPLLADYNPPIPAVLWQSLLLGSMRDMRRLQRLEIYIRDRVPFADKADKPYILGSFGSPGSFAVKFFRNSTQLQQLKYEIEADAAAKRQEKRDEFRKAKTEYVKLMQKHAESECDVSTKRDAGGMVYIHPSSCRRCGFESKANSLAVFVNEWPLPQHELAAQATVFEMAAPVTFSQWRDLTVYLINDVLLCRPRNPSTPRTTYSLKSYQPLKPWNATKPSFRIHLQSETKPNAVIH
jgi:predicted Zn-ribbon and HTH transcriptional regulator